MFGAAVCDLAGLGVTLLFGVVQSPCDGVQETDQRGFAYAPLEERVCGECAECVVADFGVGWGGAAMDQV